MIARKIPQPRKTMIKKEARLKPMHINNSCGVKWGTCAGQARVSLSQDVLILDVCLGHLYSFPGESARGFLKLKNHTFPPSN